jgi:peptidoglycan biosynthesis protein MviN/MurJ (putative lipid II flippase)
MIGQLVMLSMVWLPIFKYRLIALPTWNSIYNPLVRSSFDEVIKLRLWTASSDLITVWKSFLPYLITLLFPQIIYFIERYLASHLEIGSISGLNYAFRLVQFPLWVFIAAVSSVLFSMMAKLSATGNKQEFNRVLMNSIYFTSVFTIPFTIILFVLRVPIISILLQRGEFNSHSMAITANIMAGYTLTIIWQGFSVIWVRAALVEGKVFYAILAAAVSAVSTIGVDFILVPLVGAAGLGYGAAIGAIINFITLYMLFARFRQLRFSKLWRGLFKIVLANLPLLLVTVMFSQLWVRIAGIGTFSSKFGYVTVVIIVCLPVYWLGLRFFRVELFEKEM